MLRWRQVGNPRLRSNHRQRGNLRQGSYCPRHAAGILRTSVRIDNPFTLCLVIMASHAGGLAVTTTTLFYTGDPWGTSISQLADRLQMDRPFRLHLAHTNFLQEIHNLHDCPHLLLSDHLQLTLGCLMMKSHLLCHHTSSLLDMSVFR